ncbi:hypothetical protein D3C73_1143480 [compost metagenome]
MSADTCDGPSSRSTIFMAVKIGRSGQPVQKPAGRAGTSASRLTTAAGGAAFEAGAAVGRQPGLHSSRKLFSPFWMMWAAYSPARGSGPLPTMRVSRPARRIRVFSSCSMNSG